MFCSSLWRVSVKDLNCQRVIKNWKVYVLHVMRSEEARSLNIFRNIEARMIFSSDRTMILRVEIPPGVSVPEHNHPHEQMGICLQGQAEFTSSGAKYHVEAGTFYWIRPNESHTVEITGTEKGVFVDIFSPPREDYLEKLRGA